MPAPKTKYSVNGFIGYPSAHFISKHLCKRVSANAITAVNAILSCIVVLYILKNPCKYKIIALLCLLRAYLDILDGATARRCKEESRLGSMLDKGSDFVYEWALLGICAYKASRLPAHRKSGALFTIAIVPLLIAWSESVNQTPGAWQDNDLLLKPMLYTSFAYLSSRRCGNSLCF